VNGLTLDIRFRMLQPHELAAATSFPKSYVFTGNRGDVVKQIGNAWPGETALALCSEVLAPYASQKQVAAWRKERIA
jgi:DNA (cytosine-5)-methyltransferase 1